MCADQGLRNGGLRKPLFWHWLRRLRQTQNRQMLNPTKTRCNDIRLAMPRDRTNIASSQHGAISCDQNTKSIRKNTFVIRAGFKVHTPICQFRFGNVDQSVKWHNRRATRMGLRPMRSKNLTPLNACLQARPLQDYHQRPPKYTAIQFPTALSKNKIN